MLKKIDHQTFWVLAVGVRDSGIYAAKTGVLCVFFNPVVETTDYYIGHPYGIFIGLFFGLIWLIWLKN